MRNMLRLAAVPVLAAALAAPAFAAPETYTIDDSHTFARFSYSHFGYSTQQSRFNNVSGSIALDRAARTGSVEVVIDAKSVDTGFPLFNEHIQGEDFFHTEQHPTITFKSTQVNFNGDAPASIDGELTVKGITKPVTLTVDAFHCMPHPIVQKDACGADASAMIKRSDFDAGKHAPYVSDEVKLSIAVEAIKQ